MASEVGCAWVSTTKQDLERQVHALEQVGIEASRIFVDKKPGTTIERPGLRAALAYAREGDVLVVHTLEPIIEATGVVPALNRVEQHPHFPHDEQRSLDGGRGILTRAWSPFGWGFDLSGLPPMAGPAQRLGGSPAQVVLRWERQLGVLPVPRSTSPAQQREGFDLIGFELTDDEVSAIAALGAGVAGSGKATRTSSP